MNRNATLEREKAEMRRKLEELGKEVKTLQNQKSPSQHQLAIVSQQEVPQPVSPPAIPAEGGASPSHDSQPKPNMKMTPD
jgi:hypothetical protein